MSLNSPDTPPVGDPLASLERALIDEYLARFGESRAGLQARGDAAAHQLLKDAATYAAGRLSEVESRAHYVEEMHQSPDGHRRSPMLADRRGAGDTRKRD